MQDWKAGKNIIGAAPYDPEPAPTAGDGSRPADPTFHYATLATGPDGGLAIALPGALREKWSQDSARKDEWARSLSKFDESLLA